MRVRGRWIAVGAGVLGMLAAVLIFFYSRPFSQRDQAVYAAIVRAEAASAKVSVIPIPYLEEHVDLSAVDGDPEAKLLDAEAVAAILETRAQSYEDFIPDRAAYFYDCDKSGLEHTRGADVTVDGGLVATRYVETVDTSEDSVTMKVSSVRWVTTIYNRQEGRHAGQFEVWLVYAKETIMYTVVHESGMWRIEQREYGGGNNSRGGLGGFSQGFFDTFAEALTRADNLNTRLQTPYWIIGWNWQ